MSDSLVVKRLDVMEGVLGESLALVRRARGMVEAGSFGSREVKECGMQLRRSAREFDGLARGVRVATNATG